MGLHRGRKADSPQKATCPHKNAKARHRRKKKKSEREMRGVIENGCSFGGPGDDEEQVRSWIPWCRSLPKIELHAHLNGSIRSSTLLELASAMSKEGLVDFLEVEMIILKGDRSLAECFKLFDLIHLLTADHKTISRITKEVVEDFAAENVVYLELRTTPKFNPSVGMTKRSYMEAVLEGLRSVDSALVVMHDPAQSNQTQKCSNRSKIFVKLLLSIDRRESTQAAMDTVQLAIEMQSVGVVGVDLSGNPRVGDWQTFVPALTFAKMQGLEITLHCGEVPNRAEIQNMLSFKPGRIGHACCIEEPEWNLLMSSSIPVEVCLTSNVCTESVPIIRNHHFASLYNSRHPLVLCTDDPGVFNTNISREYALAAVCFGLTKSELHDLAAAAIRYAFAGNDVKDSLQAMFQADCAL